MNEPSAPLNIAILGATSQIARDLIISFSDEGSKHLHLFARRPESVAAWLVRSGLAGRHTVKGFSDFSQGRFDVVANFVGVGDPAKAAAMGTSIFDVTLEYDLMALDYLRRHPECRYLFLSSGAVYGSTFDEPVDVNSRASVAINHLQPQHWYAVAKLYAECRHRALSHLPIIDIRVFSYFSSTQDISARFLMSDILRAIHDRATLKMSPDYIVRDFLHPSDFYKLVSALLASPPTNAVVDCYSKEPVDKPRLLKAMQDNFGLRYVFDQANAAVNATGHKSYYYSLNTRAADFGYEPAMTSLDGVLQETAKFLRGLHG